MLHFAAFFLLAPAFVQEAPPSAKDMCEVRDLTPGRSRELRRLARDVDDHARLGADRVRIYADEDEQARLRRSGFELVVVQKDLAGFYARRATSEPSLVGVGGSMGGFRTLAEIGAELDRLSSTYPTLVSPKFSIGNSLQGRPIWAVRISDNPTLDEPGEPVAWFDALHHAREPMGGESLLLFADWLCTNYPVAAVAKRIVETRAVLLVPCVNPDGYEHNRTTNPGGGGLWRKNRRNNGDGTFGVDLNRNYGWEWGSQWPGSSGVTSDETYRGTSAFSEPEIQAVRDAQIAYQPGMALSCHTYGNYWLYPWGYDEVFTSEDARYQQYGQAMTAGTAILYGTAWQLLYTANGASCDWSYAAAGAYAFSPEIGSQSDGFWPAPSQIPSLFESVRPGYLDIAKWSGGWAEDRNIIWREVAGDGDAFMDPGETWDLDVAYENPGVLPLHGRVFLTSPTSDVTVLYAHSRFSSAPGVFTPATSTTHAGRFAFAAKSARSLRVRFDSSAQGPNYELDLLVTYDGVTTSEIIPLFLGAPRMLARDQMEISNFGWQVSNNLNYSWQRADPQGTTSGSEAAQPEDDNTPAGTSCWVTGSATGGSAGTNDVDGTTVLTSPVFRTSGFTHVELDYARWFANLPGSAQDDRLKVEVSNNDGTSWITLEETPNANAWTTKTFTLESFVQLSDAMRLRFTAADSPNNDLTEACIDDVVLRAYSSLPTLGAWGATTAGATARLFADGVASVPYRVQWSTQAGAGVQVPSTAGRLYLEGTVQDLATGTSDASGRAELAWTVPAGTVIYLQVLFDEGGAQAAYSNLLSVTIQ